jgi:2-oxoglutarate ferredoxin oxidoreductase subunit beta
MGEIVHAAHRGEKFCTFFINNAIYGMTGGQMAPTTLVGQKATTAIHGRDPKLTGSPIGMAEMLSTLEGAVYVERVALNSPAHIRKAKKAIAKAFEIQQQGLGFAFVELLSICPINWMEDNMIPVYPLKCFRNPEGVKE